MLSSWFSQKASDEGTIDGTTPRPSLTSPDPQSPPRQSTDKQPKRAFPTAFTTPHDTILSELQGISSRLNAPDIPHRPASFRSEQVASPDIPESIRDQVLNPIRSEGNLLAPTSTTPFPTSSRSAPASSDLLLDPFDGMSLGVLIPKHGSTDNDGEASPLPFNLPSSFDGPANTSSTGNEAVWNHLSRILDLQSQISKKHLEMENIGTAKGNDMKRKGHKLGSQSAEQSKLATGASSGLGLEDPSVPPGLPGSRRRVTSTVSAVSSSDEQDHEEGVDVPSEEAEKARIREDEFSKLASQFEGRKEAINDIMSKVGFRKSMLNFRHFLMLLQFTA
ncbi:hypothetical protein BDN70DRAFT_1498 [Pholiota conissans]|uniref:Uncharacterized protein n=1 Tax=Pholiota conissans TaxID=109636 RepID=A0A9P5ZFS9_9AGAR|nr:hypothetical protein BDN70DRAFT_1498 [Pholiota conissans]